MYRRAALWLGFALLLGGCGPTVVVRTLQPDADGCSPPATHVEISEEELRFATAKSTDLIAMKLDYRRETKLLAIMSKASNHLVTKSYLVCRYIVTNKIPPENVDQRRWVESKFNFLATGPTAEEIMQWDRDHAMPPGRPFSLGSERPLEQNKLATYRMIQDVGYLYLRQPGEYAAYIAPKGAEFSFLAAFDNAYQIQMAGNMKDIAGDRATAGTTELPANLVKPNGIYDVPRQYMVGGTDYRYAGGLIHGPAVIPVRWANTEGWDGSYDVTNSNPLIGYFIGGSEHFAESEGDGWNGLRVAYSVLVGLGVSKADAEDMLVPNAKDRYAGGYFMGFGLGLGRRLLAMFAIGQEHVFGDAGDNWKFQDKSWIGIGVGWNFGG